MKIKEKKEIFQIDELENYNDKIFEDIKHVDDNGNEYWKARELQKVLKYTQWRRFEDLINRAKVACENSGNDILDYFADVGKIVKTGVATRRINDYKLSRYACYLIVQNGDPRKAVIALGQTYFALQTRKQELSEIEYHMLSEDEKRVHKRNKTKKANYSLQQVASLAGVKKMDKFHNAGYKGLYNGETADDMAFQYVLNHRERLNEYLTNGYLPMTNGLDERTTRMFTIGRNHCLFSTNGKGANSSVGAYSIIETSKAYEFDFNLYLSMIFKYLPS